VADPLGSRISLLRETVGSFFVFTQDELSFFDTVDEYYLRAGALLSTPLYLPRYGCTSVLLKSIDGEKTPLETAPRLANIFSRWRQMNEPHHGQAYDSFYYL
jgi:hypothetical protein